MTADADPRADAARALHRVVWSNKTLDQATGAADMAPLAKEIVYGCLRHFYSLSSSVNRALKRPLKPKDHIIWCLMLVGAYQRFQMRVPDHAAIYETVAACKRLSRPWAKGLVNAVLRNMKPPERSLEHPDWMVALIRDQYGDQAEAIMLANSERAPMCLRVNGRRISATDYGQLLRDVDIPFRGRTKSIVQDGGLLSTGPETLILEDAIPTSRLPGYNDGLVSIQDAGAQFTPFLMGAQADSRLLDACAAPGGKLCHLLERFPDKRVTALESSPPRLAHLRSEIERLKIAPGMEPGLDSAVEHSAGRLQVREADATDLSWWDGEPYGQILLDAPCSGSGTLRRHPDIKILRKPSDLDTYATLQLALLGNLWHALEPGGTLLYCTCSIFARENDNVIARFMRTQPDAKQQPFKLDSGQTTHFGWQLLPTNTDTDGFYYSRLVKALA